MHAKEVPFIDIHRHSPSPSNAVFAIQNIILTKEAVPESICSVGIHPWYTGNIENEDFDKLKKIISHNNVLAVGECGLDKLGASDWKSQTKSFEKQIIIANDINKPLIIHCVKAYPEVLGLLKNAQVPAIFHGFNKHINLATQIIEQGYYLSLGADILRGHLDQHIRSLPLDKFFLETDDKSIDIVDIYTYFCAIRNISLAELKIHIADNFKKSFNFSI